MGDARTDEEKKAEHEKRLRDQEQNEKARDAAMRFYAEAHGIQGWKKVNKEHANDMSGDEKRFFDDGGASLSNGNSIRGLYGAGIYSNLQPGSNIHINLDDQGNAKPIIDKNWYGIVTDKEWKKAFSETMDFLAVGRGNKVISIGWDNKESVNKERLTMLMDMLEEKGLEASFNQQVIDALNDPLQFSKKEREEFYARKVDLHEKRVKKDKFIDATTNHSFIKHKENLDKAPKLDGADDVTKKTNLQKKVLGEGATEKEKDERVDLVSKELDALDKKIAEVDLAKKELETYVESNAKNLDDVNFVSESSSRTLGLMDNQFRERALPLIASMQKELDDLKLRSENWKKEFEATGANPKQLSKLKEEYNTQLALIPTPPVTAEDKEKKQKLESQIKKIDDLEKKVNKADEKLKDMKNGKKIPGATPADPEIVVTNKLADVQDKVNVLREKAVVLSQKRESEERASLKKK